ncbi:MAG: site-2 protease family protein, partial [Chloroflexi bacterium]|nr:site-2 protease family protein [Chloroflexota bacterium]
MENLATWASTIFYFLLVFGVLVLVHELGHFITAIRAGVRVEEFGFGYPPRALTLFRRGDTAYTLNWLPLGGFVKMTGEDNPSDPRSLAAQKPWVRVVILSAGAGMNLLLAVALFSVIALIGIPKAREVVTVQGVAANSPAEFVGILAGDRILRVDNTPIANREDLLRLAYDRAGQTVAVELKRGKDNLTVSLTPRVNPPKGEGPIGISLSFQKLPGEDTVNYPIWEAVPLGVRRTLDTAGQIFTGFGRMIQGTAPGQVGGPVEIARVTGLVAQSGLLRLMEFTALLSVNLAIINLFPFPA